MFVIYVRRFSFNAPEMWCPGPALWQIKYIILSSCLKQLIKMTKMNQSPFGHNNDNSPHVTIGSFHVKCVILGFYNIKDSFKFILDMKGLNYSIGLFEMMLKKLSC